MVVGGAAEVVGTGLSGVIFFFDLLFSVDFSDECLLPLCILVDEICVF